MRLLLCMGLFFVLQTARLDGQIFSSPAIKEMEKAFAETETEFTSQDEYYLGRAAAAAILARYQPYTADPELTNYLNRICQVIAINSSRPGIFNGYCVLILDSPQYSAFATPGGHIFITNALVEAAPSEDALAGIIAHEMAHIALKHGITTISNMKFTDRMTGIADRAADLAGKNPETARQAVEMRNSVTTLIDTMLQNGYSQTQEFEADKEATALLAAAGYDPAAFVEMLRVLQRVQGTQQGGFNSTHPSPARRISNVQSTIRRYRAADTRPYRVPRFKKFF